MFCSKALQMDSRDQKSYISMKLRGITYPPRNPDFLFPLRKDVITILSAGLEMLRSLRCRHAHAEDAELK